MEKRRRNRVQGSWAASQRPVREGVSSTQPKVPTKSASKTYTASDARDTKSGKSERKFVFQEDVIKTFEQAPEDLVITKGGSYDISNGPSGISRVEFYPDFLTEEESAWMFEQLMTEVPWAEKDIKVKGEFHRQPRLTAWYGDFCYSYSGLTLKPYQWSPLLLLLKDKVCQSTGASFNSMLANLYRHDKDSVDWHSDDEESLGPEPVIASLSFGETRNFELRKKPKGETGSHAQQVKIPLPGGSLLLMRGATQADWQHRVPKEYHGRGPRINLTFRNICQEVRRP